MLVSSSCFINGRILWPSAAAFILLLLSVTVVGVAFGFGVSPHWLTLTWSHPPCCWSSCLVLFLPCGMFYSILENNNNKCPCFYYICSFCCCCLFASCLATNQHPPSPPPRPVPLIFLSVVAVCRSPPSIYILIINFLACEFMADPENLLLGKIGPFLRCAAVGTERLYQVPSPVSLLSMSPNIVYHGCCC